MGTNIECIRKIDKLLEVLQFAQGNGWFNTSYE